MKQAWLVAVALSLVACGKSSDEDMKAEIEKKRELDKMKVADEKPSETKKLDTVEEKKQAEDAIPEPDPKDKKAVADARKLAMQRSNYKETIRFCEMEPVDEKSDQQARFGCALAACNVKDEGKAKAWAKGIEKALMEQALKVCTPLGVSLAP